MEIILNYINDAYGIANSCPILYVIIFFIACKCISISPLKINPILWMSDKCKKGIEWVGNIMMSETNTHLTEIDAHLKDVEMENDKRRIKDIRLKILDFSDAIKHREYSHEQYDVIFVLHEEYEGLLEKYGEKNGKVDRAMKLIQKIYDEHSSEEDF